MKKEKMFNYEKYQHHISKLKDLKLRLDEMNLYDLKDDTAMWIYLQSFPDDDILTGKYIYNFGIMDEETKKHIGDVIDYKIYLQTIVEMPFFEFKKLYQEQEKERERLNLEYPGLIMDIKTPNKLGRKKIEKTKEELENKRKNEGNISRSIFNELQRKKGKM